MIVYKTTNLINGKVYVGQTSIDNPSYLGSGLLISKAIRKYGVANFKRETLCLCSSREEMNEQEIAWISRLNSTNKTIGYNVSLGGTGGRLLENEWKKGRTYEEAYGEEKAKELRELFSRQRKGKKKMYVNSTKEEVAVKISKALQGKSVSHQVRAKISNSLQSYFDDNPEKKIQASLSMKAYNQTPDGIEAIRKRANEKRGVPQSEESNQKRRLAMKGRAPKMDVHPSSEYWYFYDRDNKLVYECLGGFVKAAKMLGVDLRTLARFDSLSDCLDHKLPSNRKLKVYHRKYYNK